MQSEDISTSERVARWRQRVWQVVHVARTEPAFLEASAMQLGVQGDQLAAAGWRTLKAGDPNGAERYFRAALHHDPYSLSAWVGLSRVTACREERRACLQAAFDLQYLVTNLERTR